MSDPRYAQTARIERAAWDWRGVLVWMAGVSAPLALGLGGAAHSALWDLSNRTTTLETQRRIDDSQTADRELRDAMMRRELRDEMRDFNVKLDRLLERRP